LNRGCDGGWNEDGELEAVDKKENIQMSACLVGDLIIVVELKRGVILGKQ